MMNDGCLKENRTSPGFSRPHPVSLPESGLAEKPVPERALSGTWEWQVGAANVEWDETQRSIHGFDPHTTISLPMVLQRLHPEDLHIVTSRMEEMLGSSIQDMWETNYRIVHPIHGIRWLRGIARAERDTSGIVTRMAGITIDVTESKLTELALRESETRIRQMLQATQEGIVSVSLEGRVLDCNPAYEKMLGYSLAELRNMSCVDFTPEKWHKIEKTSVTSQTLGRGYSDLYEKEYIRKDGTVFPVELRSYVSLDLSGNACSMWALVRDITEQRKSENLLRKWNSSLEEKISERTIELERNQTRFIQLVEASFEGIAIVFGNKIADANTQFSDLFGYDSNDVHGRGLSEFISPESRKMIEKHIFAEKEKRCEFKGLRKDGSSFPAELRPKRLAWENGLGWVFSIRDLTEMKRLENERLAREAELERTRRIAMISEVSAGIIHQIAQPLSSVSSHLACASKRLKQPDSDLSEVLEIVGDVEADVKRIKDVVVHLRSLCDFQMHNRLQINLNEVIEGVVSLLDHSFMACNARLDVLKDPALPLIEGDAVQLGQMIFNLVRNGLDASENLGDLVRRVTVTTKALPGNGIELLVADNGHGIPKAIQKSLFSPFFSTKKHGLGIGLRLCQTIVQAHGGTIGLLDTAEHQGSTFQVLLPTGSC